MSIKDFLAKPAQIQEMKNLTALLEKKTKGLEISIENYKQVQETLVKDILTLQETESRHTGNDYKNYEAAVKAISSKYNCTADWGVIQTGNIIDLRAAFILGEGVKFSPTTENRKDAEKELQWVEDFLDYNDLDGEMAQEIAKEAEIEGKIAIRMFYEKEQFGRGKEKWSGMISARYIPWTSRKYKIEANPQDYFKYEKLAWPAGSSGDGKTYEAETLEKDVFVYKKFGGRINKPDEAQPKIMKCLTQIDRLDRALWDLRKINHLFAAPTPDFEMGAWEEVTRLLDLIKDVNWKIGKAFAHTGMFSLKGPDVAGVEVLIKEIELYIKIISGMTGIPIHYLGLLDLLKNRATGDNTREIITASTTKERAIWRAAYEELITKSMQMFNKESGLGQKSTKLDPAKIRIDIPEISQEHWEHIEKVLIPASIGGIISKEHTASQIPGVDMEDEAERRADKERKDAEKAKQDLEYMKAMNQGGANK